MITEFTRYVPLYNSHYSIQERRASVERALREDVLYLRDEPIEGVPYAEVEIRVLSVVHVPENEDLDEHFNDEADEIKENAEVAGFWKGIAVGVVGTVIAALVIHGLVWLLK